MAGPAGRAAGTHGSAHVDRRAACAVQVELTHAGHALHGRLLQAVIGFNQQLRAGLSGKDEEALQSLLGQLQDNVGERAPPYRK